MPRYDQARMELLVTMEPVSRELGQNGKERLIRWLEQSRRQPAEPLLMKVLAGIGAWIASLFIVGFLAGSTALVSEWEETGAIIAGTVLMIAGGLVSRNAHGVFFRQMAVAIALAGNAMLLIGIAILSLSSTDALLGRLFFVQTILTTIAWEFINHGAYRFVATASVIVIGTVWCFAGESTMCRYLLLATELAIAGLIFHPGVARRYMPLAHASAFGFLVTIGFLTFAQRSQWLAKEIGTTSDMPLIIMLTVALAALAIRLYLRRQLHSTALTVALVMAGLLGLLTTPGVMAAILLLAAAYATADRALGVAGALFLPLFLSHYYYAMDVTLAAKSLVLAGTGSLMLLATWLLSRGWSR